MYSVMIVEDELLVRMGISSSVPWLQFGAKVVAEVADGLTAWETYQRLYPDIIIADIRMPRLNGIELLRKIREVDQQTAVILVTNVEHSATLEEVRSLGIVDVLLKATMKRDDITSAVRRAIATLPEDSVRESSGEDEETRWRNALSGREAAEDTASAPRGYVFMHICPSERLSHRLKDSLYSLFAHQIGSAEEFLTVTLESGCIALAHEKMETDRMDRVLRNLEWYIRDNFGEAVRFVACDGETALSRLVLCAEWALSSVQRDELFDQPVLWVNDSGTPVFSELAQAARTLRRCALFSGEELWKCADAIEELPKLIAADFKEAQASGAQILSVLGGSSAASGVHGFVHSVIRAAQSCHQKTLAAARPELLEAVDYMTEHIAGDLSQKKVAEIVGYHPAYFSNLFKRELGMNYSDVLTLMRIHRAEELLRDRNLSMQEVAENSGFPDLSYFSAKFKRIRGVSPMQWRHEKCE